LWTKFTTPPKSNNRGKWKNKEEVEKKKYERKDYCQVGYGVSNSVVQN